MIGDPAECRRDIAGRVAAADDQNPLAFEAASSLVASRMDLFARKIAGQLGDEGLPVVARAGNQVIRRLAMPARSILIGNHPSTAVPGAHI